jgi:cytochrome P450
MKRVSKKLEQMVFDFSIPNENSWFKELSELKDAKKITNEQFKGEITSMLVSSFSLSSALGSALLCLAARPSYQKKIHKDPAFAKYFVMEVLRLYPPFRQFGYEKINSDKIKKNPSGVATEFIIPVVKLHRDSSIWKDPNKFYPERFLESNSTKGLKYFPFGMGKRSCPGRKFSLSLITDSIKFVCSNESSIDLVKRDKMPQGAKGHLVSFAIDDTLAYRKKEALQTG